MLDTPDTFAPPDPIRHHDPILLIHGGAGRIAPARRDAYRSGLARALDAGWARLSAGGGAAEGALAAVVSMERNPDAFNAGVGGAPTRDGRVECDAAVMAWDPSEPARASLGAVAALRGCPTPSRVADRVRRESHHRLLVGAGAEAWIPAGERVDPQTMVTPYMREKLARWLERRAAEGATPTGSATVGAVALGARGDLAAVTSTGGILGQASGRVGDAPLAGAGTLADRVAAISCTGAGEAFMTAVTAKALSCALAAGADPERAVAERLAEVAALGGNGGLICITADGRGLVGFDTPTMAWGVRGAGIAPPHRGFEVDVDTAPRVLRLER